MKWLDTIWTENGNYHIIECDCGFKIKWRADISVVICMNCGKKGLLYKNEKDHPLLSEDVNIIDDSLIRKRKLDGTP